MFLRGGGGLEDPLEQGGERLASVSVPECHLHDGCPEWGEQGVRAMAGGSTCQWSAKRRVRRGSDHGRGSGRDPGAGGRGEADGDRWAGGNGRSLLAACLRTARASCPTRCHQRPAAARAAGPGRKASFSPRDARERCGSGLWTVVDKASSRW